MLDLLRQFQKDCHATAEKKEWWTVRRTLRDLVEKETPNYAGTYSAINQSSLLSLAASEISEALASIRNGNPPDTHIPEYREVEVELADVIIRILSSAEEFGWDVIGAMSAKAEYNKTRTVAHGNKII